MKHILIAVALTLMTVPAMAQPPPMPLSLKIPVALFASAAVADWSATYRHCSLAGFSAHPDFQCEANPIVNRLHAHPAAMVLTGAAIDAVLLYGIVKIVGPKHHRLAMVGLYAASAFRVYLVHANLKATTEQRLIFAQMR